MLLLAANITCIFDDETEEFVNSITSKLCVKYKNQQSKPKVYIINDSTPNAAVSSDGALILFSGLFARCKNINEFVGVVAHELGHFKARHANINIQSASPLAYGAGLGSAALAPPLGLLFLALGMQISTQETLKQMRSHEKQADNEAVHILNKAHWPSDGLYTFLKGIERYSDSSIHVYFRTHPTSRDRLENLEPKISSKGDIPENIKYSFTRVQNKIKGYIQKDHFHPHLLAKVMQNIARRNFSQAYGDIQALIKQSPEDPYYQELLGDIFFSTGKLEKACECFSKAYIKKPQSLYIPLKYSICLIETHKNDKAIEVLNKTIINTPNVSYAWHLLGKVYYKKNMPGNADFCLLEEARINQDKRMINYLLKKKINPESNVFKKRFKDLQYLKQR